MFLNRITPSTDDILIDVDYQYQYGVGSIEVLMYRTPEGTYYERYSSIDDENYQIVSTDSFTEEQKLNYMRENREEILRKGNALQFALLIDQLEQTVKTKRGNKW